MATCNVELAVDVADVEWRLKRMAVGVIQQGIDGLNEYLRQEAEETPLVARATSLEVEPGQDMAEAREVARRLEDVEGHVCPPPSPPSCGTSSGQMLGRILVSFPRIHNAVIGHVR